MVPYILVLIALVVLCASFIQSVTGFGFGIFSMIFLPTLFGVYTEGNVLSSMLSMLTSLAVAVVMWRKIRKKRSAMTALMAASHHTLSCGSAPYAATPLWVMRAPGMPQISEAVR